MPPRSNTFCFQLLSTLLVIALSCPTGRAAPDSRLSSIKLPPGFKITYYARNLPGARSMAAGDNGTIFVGTIREGRVYAVSDADGSGTADTVATLLQGLNAPNGVAFRDGSLYVAETNRVLRYDNIESRLKNPPQPTVVNDSLPRDQHHGWKYIRFGPDGLLYIPVGAPCNVCLRADKRYASILRMRPDGSSLEVFAKGIRNTVGFDWHPQKKELWFTDNGRDWLGENLPPDELNCAPARGLHFGFPFFYGNNSPDPEFGSRANPKKRYIPPFQLLGPHVAALGMTFYSGAMFPPAYRQVIFIAEHGSWNRTTPIGYRLTTVNVDGNRAPRYQVFAEGWLEKQLDFGPVQSYNAWGRPVDLLILPDGSLLVSDDKAGCIYRIVWSGDLKSS